MTSELYEECGSDCLMSPVNRPREDGVLANKLSIEALYGATRPQPRQLQENREG